MATKKRAGLGRGLSALIPQAPIQDDRAIDVFFNGSAPSGRQEPSKIAKEENQNAQTVPAGEDFNPDKGTQKPADGSQEPSNSSRFTGNTESVQTESDKNAELDAEIEADVRAALAASKNGSSIENGHDDIAARQFQNEDRVADSVHKLSTTSAQDLPMLNHGNEDAAVEPAEGLLPVPGAQLGNLDPYRIVANTRQPRSEFDEEALDELTLSIREFGVFQPIVVRPLNSDDPRRGDADYELIMGERRLRATKASGRDSIPAIIRHTDDEDMLRDALLENLHRAELNPLEEASAYQQLLDDFGCSQQELSDRIGRSRPRISNTLRLLKLPVDVQRKVAAGVLSAGHARAVLSVHEPAAMAQLSDKIINENLSVREAELAASTMGIRTEKNPSRQSQVGSDSLNAHLSTVGERLGDRLNTRVKVVLRKTKGQISIDFASVADLNRILEAIGESTEA